MSAQGNAAPIIIKKKKVMGGEGHHGGAWKVAMEIPFVVGALHLLRGPGVIPGG